MLGTTLTIIAFIPQIYVTYSTKTTKGLSIWMLILTTLSAIVWLIYAIKINATYQILENCIILLVMVVLVIIYFYMKTNSS